MGAPVTRTELVTRAARILGARIGALSTVTVGGSTTTAILLGLVNTNAGDNTAFAGWRLFIVATAGTMQETSITTWVDSTGTATFNNLGSAPVLGNTYIAVPREDYTLYEMRQALDRAFQNARRTYRQVIPLTPALDLQPLAVCDWLEGGGDVDAVWINQSPVALHNEDFSLWQNGAAAAPDGWTLASGSVARVTGGIRSTYAATLTAGRLTQSMPQSLVQWITRRTAPVYTPIRGAGWCVASSASAFRIGVRYTASDIDWSEYHTGNSLPQYLTVSHTPSAADTEYTLVVDGSGTIHAGVLMQNTTSAPDAFSIRDQGSQSYREFEINRAVRNVGGVPIVDIGEAYWQLWQLVVYCRRPFPLMTSDADVVEEQYARMLVAGLLNFLLETNKPNQDRTRIDAIRREQSNIWARALSRTADLPVPRPPVQIMIGGA